jgi:hypothetical protein
MCRVLSHETRRRRTSTLLSDLAPTANLLPAIVGLCAICAAPGAATDWHALELGIPCQDGLQGVTNPCMMRPEPSALRSVLATSLGICDQSVLDVKVPTSNTSIRVFLTFELPSDSTLPEGWTVGVSTPVNVDHLTDYYTDCADDPEGVLATLDMPPCHELVINQVYNLAVSGVTESAWTDRMASACQSTLGDTRWNDRLSAPDDTRTVQSVCRATCGECPTGKATCSRACTGAVSPTMVPVSTCTQKAAYNSLETSACDNVVLSSGTPAAKRNSCDQAVGPGVCDFNSVETCEDVCPNEVAGGCIGGTDEVCTTATTCTKKTGSTEPFASCTRNWERNVCNGATVDAVCEYAEDFDGVVLAGEPSWRH